MHVLVTGGAGFIGSHLAEYYLAKRDEVYAVDNLSTGTLNNINGFMKNSSFRFAKADILRWRGLEEAVAWADRIYHMAALVGMFKVIQDPINVLAVNIEGTERVLQSMAKVNRNSQIVIASSSAVYGACDQEKFGEDKELKVCTGGPSRCNYAISKLTDEIMGISYLRKYNLRVTIVRLFNIIGPKQTDLYGMVVPRFVGQAVNGKPITVFGDGFQTRSFCDVRDSVVGLDMLAQNPVCNGEIFNVGNEHEISIQDLAGLIKKISGSRSPIKFVPYEEAYNQDFVDVPRRRPDLKKLFKHVKLKHKWKLEETLEQLIKIKSSEINI